MTLKEHLINHTDEVLAKLLIKKVDYETYLK